MLRLTTKLLLALACSSAMPALSQSPAANEDVRKVIETFQGRGAMREGTPLTPVEKAASTFTLREGLTLDIMASEPQIEQPLYLSWDSKGHLWVTLYSQYQFPAGLKIVSYDQHLRAVFDKVPEPPPKGVKGADKVVVLEDTDGDGFLDKQKTVLEGLNIATAAIKGAGGIWVMNPPYLLFYPDVNDDDVPDTDPEVRLSGFGLEDTHAVANSLAFGPDGWLYGATGSTTTGNVSSKVSKNIKFEGQHIWRYHPNTHVFEIYAEGGGNTFSLEIDSKGRFFSGTNGKERGIHYDQGMSGFKNFGKHGPAGNPYAFGFFDHLETHSDGKRFSQAFCIYEGGLMDKDFGGRIIAPNSLQNFVYVSRLIPAGSTFKVEDDPILLTSTDRWFRPVDVKIGPDGGIWMADWYDTRLSHVSPVDDWHKTSGRIYRVRPEAEAPKLAAFDLHKAPAKELLNKLENPNKWFRRQAALELSWRNEKATLPELENKVRDKDNPFALDALQALHMLGGLREDLALQLLLHPDPYVRRWVLHCMGDEVTFSLTTSAALKELASRETHVEVLTQLLASAKRMPASVSLPIIRQVMGHDSLADDPRIPLLFWWALESKAESDREAVLAVFDESSVWHLKLARTHGIPFLARRWALAGGTTNFEACAALLKRAPQHEDRTLVIQGISQAFEGGEMPPLPPALAEPLQAHLKRLMEDDLLLAVKSGDKEAAEKALKVVLDTKNPTDKRIALVNALAATNTPGLETVMSKVLQSTGDIPLKKAVLTNAAKFDDMKLAQAVVKNYESRFAGDVALRDAAHRMLASREEWCVLLLDELDAWRIKTAHITPDVINQIRAYENKELDQRLDKHWPPVDKLELAATQKAELLRLRSLLSDNKQGNAANGHELYMQRCAACHKLFDQGGIIGPDLTGYERTSLDFWLTGILIPNAEIREGYGSYLVKRKGGQVLMGQLLKQDANGITMRDLAGTEHIVPTNDLEQLDASPLSIMPEGLLGGMTDEAIRDLFTYLMKP